VFCRLLPFVARVLDAKGGNSEARYIPHIVLHTLFIRLLQTDLTFAQFLVACFALPQTVDDVVAGVDSCEGGEAGGHEVALAKLFMSARFVGVLENTRNSRRGSGRLGDVKGTHPSTRRPKNSHSAVTVDDVYRPVDRRVPER